MPLPQSGDARTAPGLNQSVYKQLQWVNVGDSGMNLQYVACCNTHTSLGRLAGDEAMPASERRLAEIMGNVCSPVDRCRCWVATVSHCSLVDRVGRRWLAALKADVLSLLSLIHI